MRDPGDWCGRHAGGPFRRIFNTTNQMRIRFGCEIAERDAAVGPIAVRRRVASFQAFHAPRIGQGLSARVVAHALGGCDASRGLACVEGGAI